MMILVVKVVSRDTMQSIIALRASLSDSVQCYTHKVDGFVWILVKDNVNASLLHQSLPKGSL